MARYYLGCMHEQYGPRELLEQAVAGERAGFDGIACSDHFQPWWEPGESGQAWVWLGAAAQATERLPVGPAVTVGLKRYHPALIAQAYATLELMYPGRVFVGLGSGESLNESPLGLDWPAPRDQLAAGRLLRRLVGDVALAGRDLQQGALHRGAVLAHEQDVTVTVEGHDRHRAGAEVHEVGPDRRRHVEPVIRAVQLYVATPLAIPQRDGEPAHHGDDELLEHL